MSNQSKKLLISFCIIFSSCYGSPTVTIKQGVLEGVNLTTYDGRNIFGFMGIPYAQPPVGDLRFKAPQPPSSWNGTFSATNGAIRCTQIRGGEVVGDEDCLYLNVYTPQLPTHNTTLLPVMVFIYGGALIKGSARHDSYGPEYLLDYDVLFMIMNYRTGTLGFFTSGDEVAPGNFAMKDQIMALRWLQENVAAFGGDPKRVTLFGNSSGSIAVHFLTLSDLTEGLFYQFILQSGIASSPRSYRERSKAAVAAKELAQSFNCSTDNSTIMVKCLREQDAAALTSWESNIYAVPFIPTNEPESDEAVITDSPRNLIEQGKMRDLPWMTGVTSDEGIIHTVYYILDESKWDHVLANFRENVEAVTELLDVDNVTEYTDAVMEYYFNDLNADKNVIFQNFTDFIGDEYFVYPTVDLLQAQKRIGTKPVYTYLFDYQSAYTITYELTGNSTVFGTCHGDEIYSLFFRTDTKYVPPNKNMTETDLKMMKIMTALWTSYATNGVPTLTGVEDADEWLEYDKGLEYLHIGNVTGLALVMESALYEDRMRFWRGLLGSLYSAGSRQCSFHVATVIATFSISFIFNN